VVAEPTAFLRVVGDYCVIVLNWENYLYMWAHSVTDSMEVDGAEGVDLSSLREKFSREFTTLYLRVAGSACQQSNYAVAIRYLKLTESAINEVVNVHHKCSVHML